MIIAVLGKSNSGKTTFVEHMPKAYELTRVITSTSRPMRKGEVNGVHYNFYSYEEMKIGEVTRVATSISNSYERNDKNLTTSIQELSIINDFYVMMESQNGILLFAGTNHCIDKTYIEKFLFDAFHTNNRNSQLLCINVFDIN